jgi:hypothetical protein
MALDLLSTRECAIIDITEQVERLVDFLIRDLPPEEVHNGDDIALEAILRVLAGMRERGAA